MMLEGQIPSPDSLSMQGVEGLSLPLPEEYGQVQERCVGKS